MKLLTWNELLHLPVGTMVIFPDPGHDIYPYCTVKPGTLAITAGADSANGIIEVLPADPKVCEALKEWDGRISFSPMNDGYSWDDKFPVAPVEFVSHKVPND